MSASHKRPRVDRASAFVHELELDQLQHGRNDESQGKVKSRIQVESARTMTGMTDPEIGPSNRLAPDSLSNIFRAKEPKLPSIKAQSTDLEPQIEFCTLPASQRAPAPADAAR